MFPNEYSSVAQETTFHAQGQALNVHTHQAEDQSGRTNFQSQAELDQPSHQSHQRFTDDATEMVGINPCDLIYQWHYPALTGDAKEHVVDAGYQMERMFCNCVFLADGSSAWSCSMSLEFLLDKIRATQMCEEVVGWVVDLFRESVVNSEKPHLYESKISRTAKLTRKIPSKDDQLRKSFDLINYKAIIGPILVCLEPMFVTQPDIFSFYSSHYPVFSHPDDLYSSMAALRTLNPDIILFAKNYIDKVSATSKAVQPDCIGVTFAHSCVLASRPSALYAIANLTSDVTQ